MDLRLTVRVVKERIRTHSRKIRTAALIALSALAAIWALPLAVGSDWIVHQLQGQYPSAKLTQVSWRTLPVPGAAVRRIEFGDRDLAIDGDMRLHLALGPLLAGRAEPKALDFTNVTVTQKTFVSPTLSGKLSWAKTTRTLALSMTCPQNEWATAQVSLDAVDVSIGGPGLCGLAPDTPHPMGAISLHGTPQFAPGEADLSKIVLTLGTARFEGSAQLAYNGLPRLDVTLTTPRIDLDSGNAAGQDAPSGRIGRAAPAADNPFSPMGTAHAAVPAQPAAPAFRLPLGVFATLSVSADEVAHHHLSFHGVNALLTLDDGELVLNRLDGTPPGGGQVSADATLAVPGGMPILDGHARIVADHPEAVMAWAGLGTGTALPPAFAEAEGTAAEGVVTLRKLTLKSGDTGITGNADLAIEDDAVTIDRARLTLIGTPWNGATLDAQGALVSDENGLTRLDKVKISSGITSITGQVGVITVLGRPTISADLGGDHWVLDALAGLQSAPPPPGAKAQASRGKKTTAHPVDDSLALPKVQRSPLAPQIALKSPALAQGADIRLNLHPQSASFAGNRFDEPMAVVALSGDTVVIDDFKARVWGGDVVGSGRLTLRGLPQVSATVSAGGIDIGQAHLSAGPLQLTKGSASGDTRCSSIGRTGADMTRHLECTGQIRINAGEITGFDLGAIDTAAKGLSSPVGILGLAKAGTHGGRTAFTALTASLRLADGTLSTNDAKLDADGGTVAMTGRYTPAQQTMDAQALLQLAGANLPPISLRLEGPVSQPRVTLDLNALMRKAIPQAQPSSPAKAESTGKSALSPQALKGLIKSLSQP